MALWTVDFLRHDGSLFASTQPENLHLILNIDDPHTLDFEMSIHNPDADIFKGDAPNAGPYQTDWRLMRDDFKVAQGILTKAGPGSKTSEFFAVSGQSYTHYLDRRVFPCDRTYEH